MISIGTIIAVYVAVGIGFTTALLMAAALTGYKEKIAVLSYIRLICSWPAGVTVAIKLLKNERERDRDGKL